MQFFFVTNHPICYIKRELPNCDLGPNPLYSHRIRIPRKSPIIKGYADLRGARTDAKIIELGLQSEFATPSKDILIRGTMFGKLLPREPRFFDLFDRHAALTLEAAQLLLEAALKWDPELNRFNPIKKLEHQADEVTHQCIEELRKSFITPLQQEDIFRLISKMDDVIDGIHEVFEDCIIYKIPFFSPDAVHLVRLLVSAVEKMALIISQLREKKKEAKLMREKILQIHIVENQADEVLRQALGKLFDEEEDLRMVIKWKEIYEELESSIDFCEDVSNIVEGIILEYD